MCLWLSHPSHMAAVMIRLQWDNCPEAQWQTAAAKSPCLMYHTSTFILNLLLRELLLGAPPQTMPQVKYNGAAHNICECGGLFKFGFQPQLTLGFITRSDTTYKAKYIQAFPRFMK